MEPTQEEMAIIRDYIFIPYLIQTCEGQLKKLQASDIFLKEMPIMFTKALINRLHDDLRATRQKLRAANIKVWELQKTADSLNYRYTCRGREKDLAILRVVGRSELMRRLDDYQIMIEKGLTEKRM